MRVIRRSLGKPEQHIQLSAFDRSFARRIYNQFKDRAGARHIASKEALAYLSTSLRTFKPRKVVELGAGIGTITKALLQHPSNVEQVVCTESNEYCIAALHRELLPTTSRLILVTVPHGLLMFREQADMIVGDGGFYSPEEFATARLGTVFFAEGERPKLRALFAESLLLRGMMIYYYPYGGSAFRRRIRWRSFAGIPLPTLAHGKKMACSIGVARSNH